MTGRRTACLLYSARATFGTYLSMCGKSTDAGDLPEADWPYPETAKRPAGMCPRCWAAWKRDTVNHNKETKRMSATCYLCNLPTVRAEGARPNAHPECETEAARLDLHSHLHAEDIPGLMAHMGTFEAEWDVSAEYRDFRAKLAEGGAS